MNLINKKKGLSMPTVFKLFFNIVKEIIKKTFILSSRESKENLIAYLLFLLLIETTFFVFFKFVPLKPGWQFISCILPLLPLPALLIRRLHDLNKNAGFTLLPFLLFLFLLPFLNFKAFLADSKGEKLISGGILIEIILILFLIQSFVFLLCLFLKGNKEENLYGQVPPITLSPSKKTIMGTLLFVFFVFFSFSCYTPQKLIKKPTPISSVQKEMPLKKDSFIFQKEKLPQKNIVFKKIYTSPKSVVAEPHPPVLKKEEENPLSKEMAFNGILHFLFSLSIQSLKTEKEISFTSIQIPKEIIFIKALNGNVVFLIKEKELLPLLQEQSIECKKEICNFNQLKYLNLLNKGS